MIHINIEHLLRWVNSTFLNEFYFVDVDHHSMVAHE